MNEQCLPGCIGQHDRTSPPPDCIVAAPSESSAGQRHLDGLKRSSSPLVVEAATEAEATLRAESSASPEPRCDHGASYGTRRCLLCGAEFAPRPEDALASAPGGSSRHSDGAATALIEAVGRIKAQRAKWDEEWVARQHMIVLAMYREDIDLLLAEVEALTAQLEDARDARDYRRDLSFRQRDELERLRATVNRLAQPAIPDDRAVLEGRVRALLVEQIAAKIEAAAASEHPSIDATDRAMDFTFAACARLVRSFATPGDDRR